MTTQLLPKACAENKTKTVRKLVSDSLIKRTINERVSVESIGQTSITSREVTALTVACKLASREIVEILLKSGAKISVCDSSGDYPIHNACDSKTEPLSKVECLVEHWKQERSKRKGSVAVVSIRNQDDATAIHIASKNGYDRIVSFVLEKGANINALLKTGETGLHLAAIFNRLGVIKCLMNYENPSIDPNIKDREGDTALHKASKHANLESVDAIAPYDKTDIYLRNRKGYTALDIAHLEYRKCQSDDKKKKNFDEIIYSLYQIVCKSRKLIKDEKVKVIEQRKSLQRKVEIMDDRQLERFKILKTKLRNLLEREEEKEAEWDDELPNGLKKGLVKDSEQTNKMEREKTFNREAGKDPGATDEEGPSEKEILEEIMREFEQFSNDMCLQEADLIVQQVEILDNRIESLKNKTQIMNRNQKEKLNHLGENLDKIKKEIDLIRKEINPEINPDSPSDADRDELNEFIKDSEHDFIGRVKEIVRDYLEILRLFRCQRLVNLIDQFRQTLSKIEETKNQIEDPEKRKLYETLQMSVERKISENQSKIEEKKEDKEIRKHGAIKKIDPDDIDRKEEEAAQQSMADLQQIFNEFRREITNLEERRKANEEARQDVKTNALNLNNRLDLLAEQKSPIMKTKQTEALQKLKEKLERIQQSAREPEVMSEQDGSRKRSTQKEKLKSESTVVADLKTDIQICQNDVLKLERDIVKTQVEIIRSLVDDLSTSGVTGSDMQASFQSLTVMLQSVEKQIINYGEVDRDLRSGNDQLIEKNKTEEFLNEELEKQSKALNEKYVNLKRDKKIQSLEKIQADLKQLEDKRNRVKSSITDGSELKSTKLEELGALTEKLKSKLVLSIIEIKHNPIACDIVEKTPTKEDFRDKEKIRGLQAEFMRTQDQFKRKIVLCYDDKVIARAIYRDGEHLIKHLRTEDHVTNLVREGMLSEFEEKEIKATKTKDNQNIEQEKVKKLLDILLNGKREKKWHNTFMRSLLQQDSCTENVMRIERLCQQMSQNENNSRACVVQ